MRRPSKRDQVGVFLSLQACWRPSKNRQRTQAVEISGQHHLARHARGTRRFSVLPKERSRRTCFLEPTATEKPGFAQHLSTVCLVQGIHRRLWNTCQYGTNNRRQHKALAHWQQTGTTRYTGNLYRIDFDFCAKLNTLKEKGKFRFALFFSVNLISDHFLAQNPSS